MRFRFTLAAVDGGCWVVAVIMATWLRHEFTLTEVDVAGLLRSIEIAVLVVWTVGLTSDVYLERYPTGSLNDAVSVAVVMAVTGLLLLGVAVVSATPSVPRSVPLIAAPLATIHALTVRLLIRYRATPRQRPDTAQASADARPTRAPSFGGLLRREPHLSWAHDVDIGELLGRRPLDPDLGVIAAHLTGRRVLVTGAGGSIGAELCRQIHRFAPAELAMLDRDESALHAVLLSIYGQARLDAPNVILADIRDADALGSVLRTSRPHVVFHAAALKHVAMLERYPEEAWKTNVLGTMAVVEAARAVNVGRFVNISTDKAANPTSVLGRSKRIGERITADAAMRTGADYLSVRFGNVLGSRGSVLTTFVEQLVTGRPLTVTHPDVTCFVMTISEAVGLTVQAAAIGGSGEALVLDMGEPARITELAETLMAKSGLRSPIVFTGLRDGEKLHEELFGDGEVDRRPAHPRISHISVPALDPSVVRRLGAEIGGRAAMVELVGAHGDRARSPQVPHPAVWKAAEAR